VPGYHAKKRFGQNFLKSAEIVDGILGAIDPVPTDTIVEVGPGRGALTLPVAKTGARLLAIEFDRDVIGYLNKLLRRYDNATIIHTDFLLFSPDEHDLSRFKLIGNLPFNLTSPVMDWTATHARRIERAVFMVQKEVALRICSEPGSKDWSPLAIFTRLVFEPELLFDVAPEHFSPPPKVVSAVIRLAPREEPVGRPTELFEAVVRAAFRQRRKQLVNNLVPEFAPDAETLRGMLTELGIASDIRAEQLSIDDFLNLTRYLEGRRIQ